MGEIKFNHTEKNIKFSVSFMQLSKAKSTDTEAAFLGLYQCFWPRILEEFDFKKQKVDTFSEREKNHFDRVVSPGVVSFPFIWKLEFDLTFITF